MSNSRLTPPRAHALFDILIFRETYAEIQNFESPNAIHEYGPPFQEATEVTPTSPILQILLTKFVLSLPGLNSVSADFWRSKIQTVVEKLSAAELSESYDNGFLGSRKMLATAISALLESLARGVLGGYPRHEVDKDREYDPSKPDDVLQGWDSFLQRMIYDDMVDQCFEQVKETENLEEHPSVIQAAHEYILINLASFIHHVLILSPDGQYMLRTLQSIHRLVPYGVARQTLRIGNAATMINGMIKLVLTKLSVTAFTNWLGISNSTNDGMNLLQQIISTILSWDNTDFRKQALKIERAKNAPSKCHLNAIRAHLQKPRQEHETCRKLSEETSTSIVSVILAAESVGEPLSDEQHELLMEYFSLHLCISDRDKLSEVLCKGQPDYITAAIREGVSAYDPIIRSLHNAYDLSGGLADFENFLNDLIKVSKAKLEGTASELPTVDEYVALLKRHQSSAHRFLHQVAKNGPEVAATFNEYMRNVMKEFATPDINGRANQDTSIASNGAGAMTDMVTSLFEALTGEEQASILPILDEHSKYLSGLAISSQTRMRDIITSKGGASYGPGMYLAKWQSLLDSTVIGPATATGPLRSGKDFDIREASRKNISNGSIVNGDEKTAASGLHGKSKIPEAPDSEIVVRLLQPRLRERLAEKVE